MPSLGYALIYLLLIPVFALIYYELPGHFYHSTLKYEGSSTAEYDEIRRDLASLITASYREVAPTPDNHLIPNKRERPTYWTAIPVWVDHLSCENDAVNFELKAEYYVGEAGKRGGYTAGDLPDLRIPVKLILWPRKIHNDGDFDYEPQVIALNYPPEVVRIFPDTESQIDFARVLFPKRVFQEPTTGLNVPETLLQRMRACAEASQGVGSTTEGNFVRMLYLSAVTITTLGFGDVVPMTTASRLLISVEAILGIVLIGLFLNALSFERTNRTEDNEKS